MQCCELATSWFCKSKYPPRKDKAAIFHWPRLTSSLLSDWVTYCSIFLTKQVLTLILRHTLVQRCSFHSERKVSPFFDYAIIFSWGSERITGFAVTSTSPQLHSFLWWQRQFSLSSQSSTRFFLHGLRPCFFCVYWCIGILSLLVVWSWPLLHLGLRQLCPAQASIVLPDTGDERSRSGLSFSSKQLSSFTLRALHQSLSPYKWVVQ